MKHIAATTSPSTSTDRSSVPAWQLERLSSACTFARAREESGRGRVVEIVASLLFGGCVLLSVTQSATASFALNRTGALDQVVVRAMPKKTQVATAPATLAQPASRPARAPATRPL